MASGPLIVIWVLASELSTPTTTAMRQATHDALGPATEVRAEAAPDTEGMRLSDVGNADGAVRIVWDAQEHRRARLICYTPRNQRWVDREVTFAADDPESERGRTLGFLVASIFLDAGAVPRSAATATEVKAAEAKVAETKAAEAKAADASAAEARAAEAKAKAAEAKAAEAKAAEEAREARAVQDDVTSDAPAAVVKKSESDSPLTTSLAAAAQAALPGTASGFGAWLGAEHLLGKNVWLGGSLQARLGNIPEAQATSRYLAFGGHATWMVWSPSTVSRLGMRGAASLAQISIAHLEPNQSTPERLSRFVPAFELVFRAGYDFAASSGLVFDLGAEFLAGSTEIIVPGQEVATWQPLIAVARAGVQTSF